MKTRRTKVLLSLLAVMAAWFAVTNAYTFQVQNRNPFGVLNLSKLIIKDLAHTWIILDSANNTIKVTRDSAWTWQIRVYEICDENGEHCKNIANIWQGSWGWITILDWEEWHICTKSWDNLVCNTTGSNSLDLSDFLQWENWHLCRRSGNKLICNGRFWNGQLKIIYGADQYTTIPESWIIPLDGSWTYEIYIPKIVSVTWSAQNFCKLTSEGNLECNDSGSYTLPTAASGTLWGIEIGYTQNWNNYPVVLDDNDKAYVNVPRESWEGVDATWRNEWRCIYQCEVSQIIFDWISDCRWNCRTIKQQYENQGCNTTATSEICIKAAQEIYNQYSARFSKWEPTNTCWIRCFEEEPTWWDWTRLPNQLHQSGYVAAPTSSTQNLVWKTDNDWNPGWRPDSTGNWVIYTAWENIQISSTNVISATDTNTWQVNWLLTDGYVTAPQSAANWLKCWKTDANGIPGWRSCPTWSGSSETLKSWDDSLWKKTLNNDYGRYYLQPTLSNATYRVELYPWSSTSAYWAASKIVFDSKWIRINNWADFYSWAWISVGWNIMVWQESTDNYIKIYATWYNNDSNKRFEIFWNQELAIWTQSGSYIYFAQKTWTLWYRLWVNTKNPKATLDINWWVRVGKNCEQRLCTGSNVWTIVFFSNEFLWCKQVGDTYKRVSLDGWTTQTQQLWNSNIVCKIDTYVWNWQIANTTTQQEY